MKASTQQQLFMKFNSNPPVDAETIARLEMNRGISLPSEYKEFLQHRNGGEGFIGNAYAILWQAEELLKMNTSYEVDEYAPGLFLFGSDGGGEAFAFDTRTNVNAVVSVPFVGMHLNEIRPLASSFDEFLQTLFASQ